LEATAGAGGGGTPPPATDREFGRYQIIIGTLNDFNRLIIQSKTLGSTAVAALVAVGIRLYVEGPTGPLLAAGLEAFLVLLVFGLWLLDRYYWELLIAGVGFAEGLEKNLGLSTVPLTVWKWQPATCEWSSETIQTIGQTEYIHRAVDEAKSRRAQNYFFTVLLLPQIILAIFYFLLYFAK